MSVVARAGLAAVVILLSACASGPKPDAAASSAVTVLPGPASDAAAREAELDRLQQLPPTTYRIGPGDSFNVFVYDEPDLATDKSLVKPDGTLTVKLAGETLVSGKTIPEAEREIETRMRTYLRSPKVTLVPNELKSAKFTIIGKVNAPGIYPISHNTRILDAVALSGGFTTGIFQNNTVEMADLEHAFLARGGSLLPIDFARLIQRGDMRHNIPLVDGDYLYLPSSMNREVYIIGEVVAPGFFGYREDLTVMQIISRARGFTDAAAGQALIVRESLYNPKLLSVDTTRILSGKAADVKLEPGDIVFIPKSFLGNWNKILNLVLPSIQTVQTGLLLENLSQKK